MKWRREPGVPWPVTKTFGVHTPVRTRRTFLPKKPDLVRLIKPTASLTGERAGSGVGTEGSQIRPLGFRASLFTSDPSYFGPTTYRRGTTVGHGPTPSPPRRGWVYAPKERGQDVDPSAVIV